MNWILGLIVLVLLLALWSRYWSSTKKAKILADLKANWGSEKTNEQFDFDYIASYFKNTKHTEKAFQTIPDNVANDLDLDAVFTKIDRTSSRVGQQYLYYQMRTVTTQEDLKAFDELTQLFEDNPALRWKVQYALQALNKHSAYYFEELVHAPRVEKPPTFWKVKILSVVAILSLLVGFMYPIALMVLLPVIFINMVFHYKNKWNVAKYMEGIVQIAKALRVAKSIAKNDVLKTPDNDLSFIAPLERLLFKTRFISFEKKLDNEFASLVWVLTELIKILFNLEYLLFYSIAEDLYQQQPALDKLFCYLGGLDAALSVASVKQSGAALCTPVFKESGGIDVVEICHPLLADGVANSLVLGNKSLLLTGSNMSGKTTFIRSVGINAILAQTLYICFATHYEAPFFKLYSSIRISDDVQTSTSYYLEEVLVMQQLMEAAVAETPCLFILDEVFKGTNTVERIAGGKAIVSYLNQPQHTVLFATHDTELTDLLGTAHFESYYFSEHIEQNTLRFDYTLKKGTLTAGNAIAILELYKYPEKVVADAREVAARLSHKHKT